MATQDIVRPFDFDPASDPESDFEDEPLRVQRLLQDVSAWCDCGCCRTMPTEAENICCLETPRVRRRLYQFPTELSCITDHPGFLVNCLNRWVLQNINNVYRADYGPVRRRTQEERCRYVAYHSFVSWCWGLLGARVRVVIPSCAVLRIRQEFPDPGGNYVGFRPVDFVPPLD